MNRISTKKIILIVIMFVITLVLTWLVRVDIHNQDQLAGYFNLGDAGIYISVALLGGPWGALIAAVASALADIFVGQIVYAPASIVIKAAMAFLFAALLKRGSNIVALTKNILVSSIVMVLGYFVFDLVIRGSYALAAIGLPINILQAFASAIIAVPVLFLVGGKSYSRGEGFTKSKDSFSSSSGTRRLK